MFRLSLLLLWALLAIQPALLAPRDGLAACATVKIEIRQELTLERQAFDAYMRINNGLSHIPLQNVAVDVTFADEHGNPVTASSDPDSSNALFFIRVDTMKHIADLTGSGTVAPETSADIHWLIIPSPGASNGRESGTLYFVGATLTYTAGGKSESITVTPDFIYVKPMPRLVLDYFLPTDVYGDDPWTSDIEAPVPFHLGLRIRNKGHGYARALKVESAQPRIVENELGLLIGFKIEGTSVNGRPAVNSLLADFGDIAPDKAGVAHWIMTSSLSGRFVGFEAEFSHAAELGGKLTSLIGQDDVRTHFLVHSVLVDAEGRDNIEDFLAKDDDVYRVYESDNIDTLVTDQSAAAALTHLVGGGYRLTTPPTDGFMYARVADPTRGAMVIREAIRSDGKRIKPQNVWFSKTRAGSGPWQYFLNIFDHNTTGVYTIAMQNVADMPQPPAIQFIPDRTGIEGRQLSFLVEATDPNGTTPTLRTGPLPVGATFVDQQDGSGIFDWVPAVGQAGRYAIEFIAADGLLESSRRAVIQIFSEADSDGDGMPDSWELEHFGTLDRDGMGDFDGDGISDLDEYLNGFDPTRPNNVPSVPVILEPLNGHFVETLTPELVIANSIDPDGNPIVYTFELFGDPAFKERLFAAEVDDAPGGTTSWRVPTPLADNTMYHWRARAANDTGRTLWAYGRFLTDTANDPPTAPGISAPADGNDVDTHYPVLEITNSTDPEGETVTYELEVYADSAMTTLVTAARALDAGGDHRTAWTVDVALAEATAYHWRAVAVDSRGAATEGPLAAFWVNTANTAPPAPLPVFPGDGAQIATTYVELTFAPGDDAHDPGITYSIELDTDPTFAGDAKVVSDPIPSAAPHMGWALQDLTDNTWHYWRVKSSRGTIESPWAAGRFFVNTINEAPGRPELRNPGVGAWVATATPVLSVHPAPDPEQEALFYRFELYADAALTQPIAHAVSETRTWQDPPALDASAWYYWRSQAVDPHGLPGEWSENGLFFAKADGLAQPPRLTFIAPVEPLYTNAQGIVIRWHHEDPDGDAAISLYYADDASGTEAVLIADGLEDDPDGRVGYHTWDISALEGTFYIHAVIANAAAVVTVHCPVPVTIDRTPPVVTATPPGGAFEAPVQVTLTADKEGVLYYTLDGAMPDIAAEIYEAPLTIAENTTLRFMAVDALGNQSEIHTETYDFTEATVTVTVRTAQGRLLEGVAVAALTETGGATGQTVTTDESGQARFDAAAFTTGTYRFRADYLGRPFLSADVVLPDTQAIPITVIDAPVTVTVHTAHGPAAGVPVHLFSASGEDLGLVLITNGLGQVVFDLPVDATFRFRADIGAEHHWSQPVDVSGDGPQDVAVSTGGRLTVAVQMAPDEPLAGIPVRLCDSTGNDLGMHSDTDDQGRAVFHPAVGDYRARADYLGHAFWSAPIQLTADTLATIELPHQPTVVTVHGRFMEESAPLEGIEVHLHAVTGESLDIQQITGNDGQVAFELPEAAFMARADTLGGSFWTDEFTWEDATIIVPLAEALITVTAAGRPLAGVSVIPVDEEGNDLGLSAVTDNEGRCLFRLPVGTYGFRAAHMGEMYLSGMATLDADQRLDIGISTTGGDFTFTLLQGPGQPLAGVACTLFDHNGNDLGRSGITNGDGQLTFDLGDGAYRICVDYLGHLFWSEMIQVPNAFSGEMMIPHAPASVTVVMAADGDQETPPPGGCGNVAPPPDTTVPVPDIPVHLFNGDHSYQGPHLLTDAHGRVHFQLPVDTAFAFRADILGGHYWSDTIVVPTSGPLEVPIDAGGGRLELVVWDRSSNPMPGLPVYLSRENGDYLGQQQTTTDEGIAAFHLPEGRYSLRVEYRGESHWTEPIEVVNDTRVTMRINTSSVPGGCGAP
ncbi:chitobiase/beta-hexosaminidase C-terminal domain-containing protein [Desulfatitalea alkaliphila]|uniref:Chitobiase/beta-hexosaminidase C-terminal domain-containing protein n=1 Tax=Desulfatitalea alkaliphila TaxID=2929485 RepID=A0AA41R7P5_9BACT|nr:chitobiase/beta-hexosaminidase C-terminal domain-containing protein [Desulfatitalea alkaliphila]MCJ8503062.1 chitobiase/beta-hexosaminidase C-terminal domain-containing protein [Desulfatitalea alkaliphila]